MLSILILVAVVGAEPNDTPSMVDLLGKAKKGDSNAQLSLALRYRDGTGVKRDYVESLFWVRKAADSGNPAALDAVGFQYLRGWGVPQNSDVAVGYFRAAARAGNVAGMFNLGECYFSGQGVDQDYTKAIDHWKVTASKGKDYAAFRLAMIYFSGDGAERNVALAEKFCKQAADAGLEDAKVLLGEMLYQQGKKTEAMELWEQLAKGGKPSAKDLVQISSWRDKKTEPDKFAYVEYRHVHQGWNNCGAASCTMLAKFQGGKANQYDIKRLCPGPLATGTDWSDLIAAAGKLGHKWKLVTFPNDDGGFAKATAMLRTELEAGRPVGIDFNYPGGAGHTLTVAGYHAKDDVYVLRDPAHPSPGIRIMTGKELAKLWHSRGYSRVATERCRPAIVLED